MLVLQNMKDKPSDPKTISITVGIFLMIVSEQVLKLLQGIRKKDSFTGRSSGVCEDNSSDISSQNRYWNGIKSS